MISNKKFHKKMFFLFLIAEISLNYVIKPVFGQSTFLENLNGWFRDTTQMIRPPESTIQYVKDSTGFPKSIEIQLSGDGDNWVAFQISSGKVLTFSCFKYQFIRVETQDLQGNLFVSQYDFGCQSRYSVVWNTQKQQWDINLLTQEGSDLQ